MLTSVKIKAMSILSIIVIGLMALAFAFMLVVVITCGIYQRRQRRRISREASKYFTDEPTGGIRA